MFEPKNLTEKRLAMAEALINQLLQRELKRAPEGSDDFMEVSHLLDTWAFRGHRHKDEYAAEIIGPVEITDDSVTRPWLDPVLRANYGLLEAFGNGLYNPETALPGNDVNRYTDWLRGLESIDDAVSDTRVSSILRDMIGGQAEAFGGVPTLFINAGDFVHLIILGERVTMQSISIAHLPSEWEWANPVGVWRSETFGYLGNLSKAEFFRQFAFALAADGRDTLYLPSGVSVNDVDLARSAAEEAGLELVTEATLVHSNDHPAQSIELPPADLVDGQIVTVETDAADPGPAESDTISRDEHSDAKV